MHSFRKNDVERAVPTQSKSRKIRSVERDDVPCAAALREQDKGGIRQIDFAIGVGAHEGCKCRYVCCADLGHDQRAALDHPEQRELAVQFKEVACFGDYRPGGRQPMNVVGDPQCCFPVIRVTIEQ